MQSALDRLCAARASPRAASKLETLSLHSRYEDVATLGAAQLAVARALEGTSDRLCRP